MDKSRYHIIKLALLIGILLSTICLLVSIWLGPASAKIQETHSHENVAFSIPDNDHQANQKLENPEVLRISLPMQQVKHKLAKIHQHFIERHGIGKFARIGQQCWNSNLQLKLPESQLHIVFRKLLI